RDVRGDLDNIVHAAAEVRDDRLDVAIRLLGLGLVVARPHEVAVHVQSKLTGDVQRVPDLRDVGVVGLRRVDARRIDALASGHEEPRPGAVDFSPRLLSLRGYATRE